MDDVAEPAYPNRLALCDFSATIMLSASIPDRLASSRE